MSKFLKFLKKAAVNGARLFKGAERVAHQGVSVINGAVGDKLQDTPLGIEMNFYDKNKVVPLDKQSLMKRFASPNAPASPKICILIHGLTHNEMAWEFPDRHTYGSLLSKDLEYTAFHLRYNTGLHISDNGKAFADKLERLYRNYPVEVQEICIIAHSMGGLVTHSASHYAQEYGLGWTSKMKHIFLLGTPHLGSYLEKFANVTTNILERVPNWPTRLVGRAINLRSSGIKDLRFGYIKEEDWKASHPDQFMENNKTAPLKLVGVSYYVISGRLTQEEKHWVSQLFGDILVSSKSATARSSNSVDFNFPPENHYEFAKTDHFELSAMPEVYEKIKGWLAQ